MEIASIFTVTEQALYPWAVPCARRHAARSLTAIRAGAFRRRDLAAAGEVLMRKAKPTTVTEYINAAPKEAQKKLREMRAILKTVAPKATEALKWGSPVFAEKRILFAYTAFKSHLNFMATHPAMEPFKAELAEYRTGEDTIQLPYDKPLPKALIRKIAAFRVKQVRETDARWRY